MNRDIRRFAVAAVVIGSTLVMTAGLGMGPNEAEATADDAHVGDVLKTLNLVGTPADCSSFSPGTSLAIVQGSKTQDPSQGAGTGFTKPVLLVTSCIASGNKGAAKRATLYFIDPGSASDPTPATVVKTLTTTLSGSQFAPGNGWAKLVLAPDRGVLYGCGDNGELYSIDYVLDSLQNPAVPDGSVTLVMPKPAAITSCTGLAWDPVGNIVYQSSGNTIFPFNLMASPPVALTSFAAPTGCTVSGLTAVGGVLEVACNNTTVSRLSLLSSPQGTPLSADHPTMTFKGSALSDLECDPVSFSGFGFSATSRNTDAMWSKIAATNKVQAFWVPSGTCSLPSTETVFAPAACPDSPPAGSGYAAYRTADGSPIDGDGDGLWNCWKDPARWTDGLPGIVFDNTGVLNPGNPALRDNTLCVNVDTNGDGTPDTQECATPGRKDVFVEIDYMQNLADGSLSHRPDPLALLAARNTFATAPVDPDPAQPTGFKGVKVHFQVDEAIPHNSLTALEPCTPPATAANGAADFEAIKQSNFGTLSERTSGKPHAISAKRFAFRYMVFAHDLVKTANGPGGSGSSGCSEVPGDDAVISLGSFTANLSGHGVGTTDEQAGTVLHELGHNLGLRHGGGDNVNCKPNYLSVMSYSRQFSDLITNRPLDYSHDQLATLNETSLVESAGIAGIGAPSCGPGNSPCTSWKTVFSSPTAFTTPPPLVVLLGPGAGGIDWNNNLVIEPGALASAVDINKVLPAGCDGTGTSLVGFNDWARLQYNARASLDFAGGEKRSDQEQASFDAADLDGDGVPDAFNCGSTTQGCVIDIKPGTSPKVISKGSNANIQVAIRASATFDPSIQVCRDLSLTLNEVPVKVNANGVGTCSTSQSGNGRTDLICQFPMSALPLGLSKSVLQGKKTAPGTVCPPPPNSSTPKSSFRARDVITVQ
jgi:hypothetical protein